MKRILFFFKTFCGENAKGGTEIATFRIARALKDYCGYEVFDTFTRGDTPAGIYPYTKVLKLGNKNLEIQLAEFIRNNEIDFLINMGNFFTHRKLSKAIDLSGRDVKLVFMHHFSPGNELAKYSPKMILEQIALNPLKIKNYMQLVVNPFHRAYVKSKIRKCYSMVERLSYRVVLLSDNYKAPFMELGGIGNGDKFVAVPNIYNENIGVSGADKKPRVLMLSRISEKQKKISHALKIWRIIEKDPELSDWRLEIVGEGPDRKSLMKLARRLGLERVDFAGWQHPDKYLDESAVFMMTSLYEGLSLSLIEAQFCGCVPVVYNSYPSVKDVIEQDVTGVYVDEFGNFKEFARKLSRVMKDGDYRKSIAINAKASAARYSSEAVARKWKKILD